LKKEKIINKIKKKKKENLFRFISIIKNFIFFFFLRLRLYDEKFIKSREKLEEYKEWKMFTSGYGI
jgi:hypothetical protein